ncbi:hypothetical protein [Bradyrhizobium sp. NBAIM01]|uniref:hypothetical protein n=1 Tax=Bradyrhizobium sp. NBAIM01 TaxID=2793818 RepID=UPI001CD4AA1F|nr:hypothetical protein [Bradyrhizobium sp. NBAIM01]MCA1510206.1 hypothetical protein [Bradyrhizobium sp. NBAIM01]
MSHTQEMKEPRTRQTRCARRSLVELTAAASRAVDDGLFVSSLGIAASNPRSEHTGANTSDQIVSDTTTEMMAKVAEDSQDRASGNIKAGLNAALDHAKGPLEARVGGKAASKNTDRSRPEGSLSTFCKERVVGFRADATELNMQKEPADSAGQSQPRYMRRLTDEAVRLLDDLRSGKLEHQANFILSECFREAASAFSILNQQLKRDGYPASIDPSIFIWLANIAEPETRDTGTMRLEIVPNHRGRPSTYTRQVAQFIWHLVEGQGCRRQAAYRAALTKFTVTASFVENAYAFWEPIFKRAGPHVRMLTRISDPEV